MGSGPANDSNNATLFPTFTLVNKYLKPSPGHQVLPFPLLLCSVLQSLNRQLRRTGWGCVWSVAGSRGRRENSVATASNFCVLCFPPSSPSHIPTAPQTTGLCWDRTVRKLRQTLWLSPRAEMKPLGLEQAEQGPTWAPPRKRTICYVASVLYASTIPLTSWGQRQDTPSIDSGGSGAHLHPALAQPTPRSLLSEGTFWTGGLDGKVTSSVMRSVWLLTLSIIIANPLHSTWISPQSRDTGTAVIILILRWGNQGPERLSNFSDDKQLVDNKATSWVQAARCDCVLLTPALHTFKQKIIKSVPRL